MKKINKKDVIAYLLFFIIFILIYFVLTRNKFIYGSLTDFENQHFLIPEYFRNLFYKTKDLFPDFAFNLGAGQNIYYFSYYGLLSPIIMLSYLFPFIKMIDYIIISSILTSYISTIMLYHFLKKHNYKYNVCLLSSILFLCAGPIIFHTHRHIMFITYMPFLIIGLYGIDNYFKTKKYKLLILSIFLMIMTNYYYSVSGLFVLFIYAIFIYINENKDYIKNIKQLITIIKPFIIGIMMSAIIIIPTLYTLLNGREVTNQINYLNLFIPNISFKYLLYGSYGIGVSLISLISIIYNIKSEKKEFKFLSVILLLISIFSIFNYILNGTLYIDSKSLIPFVPLVIIVSAEFLDKLLNSEVNYKIIFIIIILLMFTCNIKIIIEGIFLIIFILSYKEYKNKYIIYTYIILISLICSFSTNLSDRLIPKQNFINDTIHLDDDNIYRSKYLIRNNININKIDKINEEKTTIYSSTYNKEYNKFYYDEFNNPIPFRNRSMTVSSDNQLFSMFMGEKYIITNKEKPFNTEFVKQEQNVKIYKNKSYLPIGYARSNILNLDEYKKLNYPSNVVALLNNVVVNDQTNHASIIKLNSSIPPHEVKSINFKYQKKNKHYLFNIEKKGKIKIKINQDMTNKILFIRFKNNINNDCKHDDTIIKINNIKNKLTCSTWKYHNQNYTFDYVIYNTNNLYINISKGSYDISDLEVYILDYNQINTSNIDEFKFDQEKTKGDKIVGSIDVREDGYFNLSVPYDKGFNIYLDSKKINYEKTNISFIGFKINKGKHKIEIEYKAPYKKEAIIISLIGLVLYILYLIKDRRKKNGNIKSRKLN